MTYQTAEKLPEPQDLASREALRLLQSPGYVYFVLDAAAEQIKIGHAKDPHARHRSLQVGNPNEIHLLGWIARRVPIALERELHERFAAFRVRGEWFECVHEIVDYIRDNRDPAWPSPPPGE
jgi:hypothetical protein